MSVLSLLLAVIASSGYFDQSTDALKTNIGSTGACNLQSTDALKTNVGSTGACNLRNPPKMESLDNCTDASETNVGSTGVLC